jgi:hypothetical protein
MRKQSEAEIDAFVEEANAIYVALVITLAAIAVPSALSIMALVLGWYLGGPTG